MARSANVAQCSSATHRRHTRGADQGGGSGRRCGATIVRGGRPRGSPGHAGIQRVARTGGGGRADSPSLDHRGRRCESCTRRGYTQRRDGVSVVAPCSHHVRVAVGVAPVSQCRADRRVATAVTRSGGARLDARERPCQPSGARRVVVGGCAMRTCAHDRHRNRCPSGYRPDSGHHDHCRTRSDGRPCAGVDLATRRRGTALDEAPRACCVGRPEPW